MKSCSSGTTAHRAFWGADIIPYGVTGTVSRRRIGELPPAGVWTRLEVPAADVGLEARTLNGMAFTVNAREHFYCVWSRAGKLGLPDLNPLLSASVIPYPVPLNSPVSVTFTSKDATTGNPVAGKVNKGGAVIGDTNTTFSHTFETTRERVDGQWKVIYPVVTVSVPGYPDMDVDCGFP